MSVKRCVQSFTVWRGGAPITFTAGQLLEEKHPILKTHGHLFQDAATAAQPRQAQRIEAATADPGEHRTLTPPAAPQDPGPGDAENPDEVDAYDPTEHSNREVLAHLETVTEAEALRILDAEEAAETPRAGIRKMREQVLEDARARDQLAAAADE
ncbi:hypothetical protein [Streptomyces sp. NPDC048438]|uniref:hypothetical protein n=1 Tax=Streptomyces sp. NPDC048438 TaxID=3365551 RepID=UPI00371564B5